MNIRLALRQIEVWICKVSQSLASEEIVEQLSDEAIPTLSDNILIRLTLGVGVWVICKFAKRGFAHIASYLQKRINNSGKRKGKTPKRRGRRQRRR